MEVRSYLIEAHIIKKSGDNILFLLLKRAEDETYPNVWQMVTGSIKKDEKAWETALREIKEETSLIPEHFWVVPTVNSFYNEHRDDVCMVPVFLAEVPEESNVIISDEHSEYKWVTKEEAKDLLAWPGQRNAVDIIYDYFLNQKSVLNFIEINL